MRDIFLFFPLIRLHVVGRSSVRKSRSTVVVPASAGGLLAPPPALQLRIDALFISLRRLLSSSPSLEPHTQGTTLGDQTSRTWHTWGGLRSSRDCTRA